MELGTMWLTMEFALVRWEKACVHPPIGKHNWKRSNLSLVK